MWVLSCYFLFFRSRGPCPITTITNPQVFWLSSPDRDKKHWQLMLYFIMIDRWGKAGWTSYRWGYHSWKLWCIWALFKMNQVMYNLESLYLNILPFKGKLTTYPQRKKTFLEFRRLNFMFDQLKLLNLVILWSHDRSFILLYHTLPVTYNINKIIKIYSYSTLLGQIYKIILNYINNLKGYPEFFCRKSANNTLNVATKIPIQNCK